jgi:DNA polymerase II small subunit/DNA polymerase delta subunit B
LSSDSFALESLPQIYIVAKQNEYSTRLFQNKQGNCRLVTVPSSEDGIISINSKTLAASLIS